MTNDRQGRRHIRKWGLGAGLEARRTPSVSGVGANAEVLGLGLVSRAAALQGVEARASIAEGGVVTFQFEVLTGGRSMLFVRHDILGMSLDAKTPMGSTAINPGPARPFRAVTLDLVPGTYEVAACARGQLPVFVAWELLLNSGVGQAATVPAGSPAGPSASAATTAGLFRSYTSGRVHRSDPSPRKGLMGRAEPEAAGLPSEVVAGPGGSGSPGLGLVADQIVALVFAIPLPTTGLERSATETAPGDLSWFGGQPQPPVGELPAETTIDPLLAEIVTVDPLAEPERSTAAERTVSLDGLCPGLALGAAAVTIAPGRRDRHDHRVVGKDPPQPCRSSEPTLRRPH